MRNLMVFAAVVGFGCSGDDKASDSAGTGDADLTGTWSGSCDSLATESGSAVITDLTLTLTDDGGDITGTWDSIANIYTTTTTTGSTVETYPVSGTRTGSDVVLDVDTGAGGYPLTLTGSVAGDTLTLDLELVASGATPTTSCTLGR